MPDDAERESPFVEPPERRVMGGCLFGGAGRRERSARTLTRQRVQPAVALDQLGGDELSERRVDLRRRQVWPEPGVVVASERGVRGERLRLREPAGQRREPLDPRRERGLRRLR
jgi:hypothetical protein